MPDDLQLAIAQAEQALEKGENATSPRWLRVSTVCRRLDVKKRAVYAWMEQGVFPEGSLMRLPNGHWRIKESAIVALERQGGSRSAA